MMLDKKLVDCFEEIKIDQEVFNNNQEVFNNNQEVFNNNQKVFNNNQKVFNNNQKVFDLEHKKLKENFFPSNEYNINEPNRKFTRGNQKNQYNQNRNSTFGNGTKSTFKFNNRKFIKER
jgi:hypothetical protein